MKTSDTSRSAPNFAVAGVIIDALAAQDFDRLAAALDPDAQLSALLPRGFCEWQGATEICGVFEQWFGDTVEFEVADASVGAVGGLLQLRWRVVLKAVRRGDEPVIAEQLVYAVTGPTGRISRMSLLCSGFWEVHS